MKKVAMSYWNMLRKSLDKTWERQIQGEKVFGKSNHESLTKAGGKLKILKLLWKIVEQKKKKEKRQTNREELVIRST